MGVALDVVQQQDLGLIGWKRRQTSTYSHTHLVIVVGLRRRRGKPEYVHAVVHLLTIVRTDDVPRLIYRRLAQITTRIRSQFVGDAGSKQFQEYRLDGIFRVLPPAAN